MIGSRRLHRLDEMAGRLAARRGLAVFLVGLLGLVSSGGVASLLGVPAPKYHDEFSYRLAADTFAAGRVTNPTHPLWEHFETIHVIHQPTYASKFPPAQGLVLAAGQALTGDPVAGVWLGVALMSAAICWMLYAWLPPRWALLGGCLVVVRFGAVDYWAQSYWGGAVAAAGGALLYGALRRVIERPNVRDACLLGLGLATLANSRPFEGLLASVPAAVVLTVWMIRRHGPPLPVRLMRVALPLGLVLALTAGAMAYYNFRVTGDPMRLPYQVHSAQYRVEPAFLWQTPGAEPAYRHEVLRRFHAEFELAMYRNQQPIGRYGYRAAKLDQFDQLWQFLVGAPLTLAFLMLPWTIRDRWMRLALVACALVSLGLLFETWVLRHYAAPVTGLIMVLAMAGLRHWHERDRAVGRLVVGLIAFLSLMSVVSTVATDMRGEPPPSWHLHRAALLDRLEHEGGRHVVIVRYGPAHIVQNEWVYNEADIDAATVVWARDMGADRNGELVEYFRDRRIWVLDVRSEVDPPTLEMYPGRTP